MSVLLNYICEQLYWDLLKIIEDRGRQRNIVVEIISSSCMGILARPHKHQLPLSLFPQWLFRIASAEGICK